MNQVIKAIMERRSIRDFKPETLTAEQIDALQKAALASPSAVNRQPWHFSFVYNQDLLARISSEVLDSFRRNGNQELLDRMKARHESIFYGAPLVVFISVPGTPEKSWYDIDAGIAVQNLAIAAQSLGLGSCIIGMAAEAFRGAAANEFTDALKFPLNYEFSISIAIGHAAVSKEAHEMRTEKISVVE